MSARNSSVTCGRLLRLWTECHFAAGGDATSARLTVARGTVPVKLWAAFSRAASLIWILLTTATAPAVLAIRVAAPLCWITSVLPSQ